jgi:hypothetical protein
VAQVADLSLVLAVLTVVLAVLIQVIFGFLILF